MAPKRKRAVDVPRLYELLSKAVLEDQQHLLPLSDFPPGAVLVGLLDISSDLWEDKEAKLGEHLLGKLIRFCEELREDEDVQSVLWQHYNLMLTAIAGTVCGSKSEQVLRLRRLNAGMQLQDFVTFSMQSRTTVVDPFQIPFVLTGAALQGFIDVVIESKAVSLGIGDMIYLATGLVEPCGVKSTLYMHEWLLLLHTVFQGVNGVDSTLVMEPLELILGELANHPCESLEYDVFLDLLCSLTFSGLAKASRRLFQAALSIGQISKVVITIVSRIQVSWLADDEEAVNQLRGLLNDICQSGSKVFLDVTPTETSRERLYMVVYTVQLYCAILLKFVRSTPQRLLEDEEKEMAGAWLRGMETQARSAQMTGTERLDYKQAIGVLRMALSLTEKPIEYRYGVPIW